MKITLNNRIFDTLTLIERGGGTEPCETQQPSMLVIEMVLIPAKQLL